jgi:hypothetical protein
MDDQQYVTVPGKVKPGSNGEPELRTFRSVKAAALEVVDTDYGVMYTAKREVDADNEYHRIHHFMFPFFTMVAPRTDEVNYNAKAWVPIDDHRTLVLEAQFRRDRPWSDSEREEMTAVRMPLGFLPPSEDPGGAWIPNANLQNHYQRDLELQRTTLFCGILSNPAQDAAMQESMGTVVDRTGEHLCASDAMITRVRRVLIVASRRFAEQERPPPTVHGGEVYGCRPVGIVLPKGADWVELTKEQRLAKEPSRPE